MADIQTFWECILVPVILKYDQVAWKIKLLCLGQQFPQFNSVLFFKSSNSEENTLIWTKFKRILDFKPFLSIYKFYKVTLDLDTGKYGQFSALKGN